MIKFEAKFNLKPPDKILTTEYLEQVANMVIIPEIVGNINRRVAIDGGALPANDPKTIKRKGRDNPLIETGRLHRGIQAKKANATTVKITISSDRKDIGKYLQIDGIKTKTGRKFYKFFGINTDMEQAAVQFLEKKVKEACEKFNGK